MEVLHPPAHSSPTPFLLEQCSELLHAHVDILEDLHEQPDSDNFAGVNRHRRGSAAECLRKWWLPLILMTAKPPRRSAPMTSRPFSRGTLGIVRLKCAALR